jgi:uncharacterized protein (TIGR03437 family)
LRIYRVLLYINDAIGPPFQPQMIANNSAGEFMSVHHPMRTCLSRRVCTFAASALLIILISILSLESVAAQVSQVAAVSAATFDGLIAPESIVAVFGNGLATTTQVADVVPLPLSIAGTSVMVIDSQGVARSASLFFVSPGQVNCQIPAGTAAGAATIRVTSGTGAMGAGIIQITAGAPAIFTANSDGMGVPAASLIRVKVDQSQTTESPVQGAFPNFSPRPTDLGPIGEQVFLILYLTGMRAAQNTDGNAVNGAAENVRVLIGGIEVIPTFAGPAPGFVGLEQINALIPRELIGRGRVGVSVSAIGFGTSKEVEVDIASPSGLQPIQVTGLDAPPSILARDLITINGTNLPTIPSEFLVRIGGVEAGVESASSTQLMVRVPFAVTTGPATIETIISNWISPMTLPVRTSMSGLIRDTREQPLPGIKIRLIGSGATTETASGGWFVIPDAPTGSAVAFAVETPNDNPVPYPTVILKMPVYTQRDNPYPESVYLQPSTGPSLLVGDTGTGLTGAGTNRAQPAQTQPTPSLSTGGVTFKLPAPNVSAIFPNAATSGNITLDLIENSLTPIRLPGGVFSSTIIQLTPFGVKLDPGGQLIFPNVDGLPAGTVANLYAYDFDTSRESFGSFVDLGPRARVSADGQLIVTDETAITLTTFYFVAVKRQQTTITGLIIDGEAKTPLRGAIVRSRGQQTLSDGNGGFTLRNVPTGGNERISVSATSLRPTGRVDRAMGATLPSVIDGLTKIAPLIISDATTNRPPYIYAPTTITAYVGQPRTIPFFIRELDARQLITQVNLSGADFVTLESGGVVIPYRLNFTPTLRNVGNYQLVISATDSEGGTRLHTISLIVRIPPVAQSQMITIDEDKVTPIQLNGIDTDGQTLVYEIKDGVKHGQLTGKAPNLIYTPTLNYFGPDSFTFVVDNGLIESALATVQININPVNDAPIINLPAPVTIQINQPLSFNVTATDPEGGSSTIAATGLPAGAQFNPQNGLFNWTPSASQIGTHTVTFMATDNSQPPLSSIRMLTITVTGAGAWAATAGPDGGTVNAFIVNGSTMLLGTEESGIFRSTNGAISWAAANTGLGSPTVHAFVVFNSQIYAGTENGIYRSSDNGSIWTAFNVGITNNSVRAFVVVNNFLFAATDGGVFRLLISGNSWTQINSGLQNLNTRALAAVNEQLFVGTRGGGVFVSTNSGATWTPFNTGLPNLMVLSLAIREPIGGIPTIFAGTEAGGVYVRASGTSNWLQLNDGLGGATVRGLLVSGNFIFAATQGSGIYRLSNFTGTSGLWMQINNGLTNTFLRTVFLTGSVLYVGTQEGGIYRSANNGDNWATSSQGLPRAHVNYLLQHSGVLYAATTGGVYVTANQGQSWVAINNGLTNQTITSLASNGTALFAGSRGNGVYRSTNNGANWSSINRGLGSALIQSLIVRNGILLAGTDGGGIYRSIDNGENWVAANSGLTNGMVFAFTSNGGSFFAGTRGGGIFRSTEGQSWVTTSQGLSDSEINTFTVVDGVVYAGTTNGGVFRSANNGESWMPASQGLTTSNIQSLVSTSGAIFAGTPGSGVFVMLNNAQNWAPLNNGLGDLRVLSLATLGNALFAGTDGSGVFILR